jgi:endonuclease/exonuclease/phosphatase family metal-dependent hydrolase
MPGLRGSLRLINWNIGGAKYLELKPYNSKSRKGNEESREDFRKRLNEALRDLIGHNNPSVVTLQEVVQYSADPNTQPKQDVIDPPTGYHYFPHWLIDTDRHGHQGKWNKVRENGEWPETAYFAQGNALLIADDVAHFPIWSLPAVNQDHSRWLLHENDVTSTEGLDRRCVEIVALEDGLYFGDRNTEPRAALVSHLVLSEIREGTRGQIQKLSRPLDIFVIVLHLTTLMMEREGVPDIDEEAAQIRQIQLDTVLNGIISRYNRWRREGFPIRGKKVPPRQDRETHERHSPIWVIAGDFNFTPEAVEYQSMARRGFIDLLPAHHLGTKTSGLGAKPTLTVDYVFAGPRFEALDPSVVEGGITGNHVQFDEVTRVSDHYPLIIDLPIGLSRP